MDSDQTMEIPNTAYRLIFHIVGMGWARGWFGDSYLEGCKYAGGLSSYDVRIIRNDTGEVVYERPAQFVVRAD